MSTLFIITAFFAGITLFLFSVWKRLYEDYSAKIIFSSSFTILSGSLLGGGVAELISRSISSNTTIFYSNGLWFWGAFLGAFVGLSIMVRKYKLRFFEVFEAVGVGFLLWLTLIFLPFYWPASVICALLFVSFLLVDNHYKKFSWYKSGKAGFSGLVVLGSGFLIRSSVALVFPTMISFMGRVDAILSAAVAFLLFFAVYNLSQA